MMFRQLSKMAKVRLVVPLQVLISALFIVTINTECITPRNTPGTCVNVHKCPAIINILTNNPLVPELVSFLQKYNCGYEGNIPRVCCENDAEPCMLPGKTAGVCVPLKNCNMLMRYLEKTPLLSNTTVDILRQSECQTSDDFRARVCCPIMQVNEKFTAVPEELPKVGQCGVHSYGNKLFSYGANQTDIYEFPWMALLEYGDFDDPTLGCGGSLITSRHVLTAAHCVTGNKVMRIGNLTRVRLGEYDIKNKTDCIGYFGIHECADPIERIDVEKVIFHEGFSFKGRVHDIALIKLKRSVKYTDFVRPICLPNMEFNLPDKFIMAGWGETEKEKFSNVKLKLELPMYNTEACRKIYSNLRVPFNLGSGQICAGGELGKDSCTADSGGPLMSTMKGGPKGYAWYQLGVVSFGPKPCGQVQPGVYTQVSEYLPWIYETLQKMNTAAKQTTIR